MVSSIASPRITMLSPPLPPAASPLPPTCTFCMCCRGKVLALELLKILLENSGPEFRRGDKFIAAIRQYLCVSLLKNIASSMQVCLFVSGKLGGCR